MLLFHRVKTGLANKKTVTIQPADKDQAVVLATTKTKKQNKPAALLHKSVMKKEFSRMAKAVENQVIRGLSLFCNALNVFSLSLLTDIYGQWCLDTCHVLRFMSHCTK